MYTNHMPARYRRADCSMRLTSSHGHYIAHWETPGGRVYEGVTTNAQLYDAYTREIREGRLTVATVEAIRGYAREGRRIS